MEVWTPRLTLHIEQEPFVSDATRFVAGMACPKRLEYQFVRDLVSRDGKSPAIEIGIVIHKILEHYYRTLRDGKPREDALKAGFTGGKQLFVMRDVRVLRANGSAMEAQALIDEYKITPEMLADTRAVIGNLTPEDEAVIATTMADYFAHYSQDSWTPIDVECVRKGLIYEDRDIRVLWKAILDLIVDTNQGIYPVDHKTMRQRRDTVSLNHQLMGQSVLLGSRGVIINKIGLQKTLKPAEKFTRPIVGYTAEQLHEWATVIVPYWAKQFAGFEKSGFYPRNYASCETKYGFCPFKPVCETPRNMREEMIANLFVKGEKWDVVAQVE